MAWVRTSISVFVTAGVVARLAALDGSRVAEALGGLAAAGCLASVVLWWRRFRASARTPGVATERITASSGAIAAVVAAVACVGAASLVLAVVELLG
ncbi:MAG: hypothetical protein QOI51_2334 [Nocardioidaceae bacterium]|jgi:hypothetical protein|nr:hypothetical protein [Nocardioidaceae bacterium]MDX6308128.1 hypothetical protein [Nocardioidaceae bacterium]